MNKLHAMPDSSPPHAGVVICPQVFRPPPRGPARPGVEIPWRPLLVSLALALWALAAWFVFTARSVTLAATPDLAHIHVAGGLAPRIGQHWLLRPGQHRVVASAPGYKNFDALIEVDDTPIQTRTVALERLPGHLRVRLTPTVAADVLIDNAAYGKAPGVVRDIPAGARQLEIRAPRYRPHITQLNIEGRGLTQSLTVVLEPAWADYSLATQPSGAQLSIDGQPLGNTPRSGELLEGRRVVKLTLIGYKPWQQTLKVVAGAAVKLGTVVLTQADGQLNLTSSPAGASVTLDDNFVGRTPLMVAIAPGTAHRLHLLAEGYLPTERDVSLAPAVSAELSVTLEAELANVQFITTPPAAELLIDGQTRGTANQTLALPTREHEITIRALGFATYTTKVTPRKAVEKRFTIRLKTIAEVAAEPPVRMRLTASADSATLGAGTGAGQRGEQRGSNRDRGNAAPATASVTSFAGQELKLFTGGKAVLGSSRADRARRVDEVERAVVLKRAFYLGTKEVSNGEFRRFLGNHHSPALGAASLDDDSQPVVEIGWHEAALYCNWLARHDGLPVFYQIKYGEVLGVNPAATGYRLPTEAEWEWAARVPPDGAATVYSWGDRYPPPSVTGNYADEAAQRVVKTVLRGLRDGFAVSAPVGTFAPNQRGIYDLGGNVAEWVHDYYDAQPANTAAVDPLGPASGSKHVIKGASWAQSSATALRLAARTAGDQRHNEVGFRLARYAQ